MVAVSKKLHMYLKTWSYFAENGWTRGENWILWRVVGGNWDGVTLDFPADRKILASLFSIWVRYRIRDEFSCRLLRRIRILRHPFLRMRLNIEKSYKNNNNILNGMKQMDIKNCTSDEIKDKGKEIMKFCFNKVQVFTLWIKLCSPI